MFEAAELIFHEVILREFLRVKEINDRRRCRPSGGRAWPTPASRPKLTGHCWSKPFRASTKEFQPGSYIPYVYRFCPNRHREDIQLAANQAFTQLQLHPKHLKWICLVHFSISRMLATSTTQGYAHNHRDEATLEITQGERCFVQGDFEGYVESIIKVQGMFKCMEALAKLLGRNASIALSNMAALNRQPDYFTHGW